MLGRVLFSGDDAKKDVEALSGGEAARLVLCRLMVEKPNVLVLDEPTNHLDMEAIQALVDALKAYQGTVIFVSHDRWFVAELATRVIEIRAVAGVGVTAAASGVRDFPGSWADYLNACGDDHLDADAVSLKERKAAKEGDGAVDDDAASAWADAKRKRALKASLEKKRDKLLKDLESKEAAREKIRALWASEGFYDKTAVVEQQKLAAEESALSTTIEALVAEWERIESELSA